MSEKIYQVIQDRILAELEKGVVPWRRTWDSAQGAAKNIITNNVYRGINWMMLNCQGYSSPYWMTYKQARTLGGFVKKGEKASPITVFVPYKKKDNEEDEDSEYKRRGYFGYANVFNLTQTEDVKVPKRDSDIVKKYNNSPIENCEQILKEMREFPEIVWGMKPCYSPHTDKIGMPKLDRFHSPEEYYSTFFHELAHSTKSMQRMNREKYSYAREELIAEISACFLCGIAGIETQTISNTAAYIASRKKRIKEEGVKMVVQAASEAQKVADWILNINEFTKLKDEKKAA